MLGLGTGALFESAHVSWKVRLPFPDILAFVRTSATAETRASPTAMCYVFRPRRKLAVLSSRSVADPLFAREVDNPILCLQFISLLSELGTHRVSEVFSQNVDRFSPLFVGDHMVAL